MVFCFGALTSQSNLCILLSSTDALFCTYRCSILEKGETRPTWLLPPFLGAVAINISNRTYNDNGLIAGTTYHFWVTTAAK